MKMLLTIAWIVLLGWNTVGHATENAKLVKQYVLKHYPGARLVNKKKISEELYHVHLIQSDRSLYVDINTKGEILFEEKELVWKELPVDVLSQFKAEEEEQFDYGLKIEFEDGSVYYFVELFEGGAIGTYLFDGKGHLLRRDFI